MNTSPIPGATEYNPSTMSAPALERDELAALGFSDYQAEALIALKIKRLATSQPDPQVAVQADPILFTPSRAKALASIRWAFQNGRLDPEHPLSPKF